MSRIYSSQSLLGDVLRGVSGIAPGFVRSRGT